MNKEEMLVYRPLGIKGLLETKLSYYREINYVKNCQIVNGDILIM